MTDLGQTYRERNEALKEVVSAHHDALFRLALAADFKDNDTGIHMVRIGFLAERLARAFGSSRPWAEMLRKAAPMHDIGRIGIPDAVLKKPGRFDPDEQPSFRAATAACATPSPTSGWCPACAARLQESCRLSGM